MLSKLPKHKDWALFVLRFALGVIFIYASVPKLTTTFFMAGLLHLPYLFVLFLGLVELFGGLGLILGWWIQRAAFILGLVVLGAIYFKIFVWGVPFAAGNTTGWEFDLILLVALFVVLTVGGGEVGISKLKLKPGDKEPHVYSDL